mgnify:CR=1 FL=1
MVDARAAPMEPTAAVAAPLRPGARMYQHFCFPDADAAWGAQQDLNTAAMLGQHDEVSRLLASGAIRDLNDDIKKLPAPVHVVFEFDAGRRVPRSILSMLAYALQQLPDNVGTVTIVTNGNMLIDAIMRVADRLHPFISRQLELAPNYDAAYKRVATLPLAA